MVSTKTTVMNICLNNAEFIGCFVQCDDIDTGLVSNQSGIHTLSYFFLDGQKRMEFNVAMIGDNLIIPNIFNEFAEAVFRITQPDGTLYTSGGNDTFKVRIVPQF